MHGIRREDVYKTPEEAQAFTIKLEKGFKLLDSFVSSVRDSDDASLSTGILADKEEADRMFALSSDIIDFMPEFYPSWHYRKNYLLHPRHDRDNLHRLLIEELTMIVSVLKKSPKSFAVWQHRLWVLSVLFSLRYDDLGEILTKELSLCMVLFGLDGRNFHGWGHVNYVRHYLKLLETGEAGSHNGSVDKLCYTEFTKLIDKNFSNSSAWFHRGLLSENHGSLSDELDGLTPAIYTDPNDQCLWEHFDWLMYKRNALGHYLVRHYYSPETNSLVFYFNDCVKLSPNDGFILGGPSEDHCCKLEGVWSAICSSPSIGKLKNVNLPEYAWRYTLSNPTNICSISFLSVFLVIETKKGLIDSFYFHMRSLPKCNVGSKVPDDTNYVPQLLALRYKLRLSADEDIPIDLDSMEFMRNCLDTPEGWKDLSSILRGPIRLPNSTRIVSLGKDITDNTMDQQMAMIQTLLDMGTESKYLHLAMHKMKRYVGEPSDPDQCYNNVQRIDTLRGSLYKDLLLMDKVDNILDSGALSGSTSADLSGIGISRLTYRNLQPHVLLEELNLSNNNLGNGCLLDIGICLMLKLRFVNLSLNKFTHLSKLLEALRNLSILERIDLSGNPLTAEDDFGSLHIPESLCEIDIANTPLAEYLLNEAGLSSSDTNESRICQHIPGFVICVTTRGEASESDAASPRSYDRLPRVFLRRTTK
ncbi:prenyltransferase alpha [Babesia ovis]|uniref:Geranylgeranyl transferase type-2 subunit alpha n=1 Tax=Babesia ovis TaxID=5869 RepID=A0A9W5WUS6_BABOV|nr:prenyltransferase alpha [Babesia ovis]